MDINNVISNLLKFVGSVFGRHFLLILALLVFTLSVSHAFVARGYAIASEWSKDLQPGPTGLATGKPLVCVDGLQAPKVQLDRLNSQIEQISGRIKHHLDVMIFFYANYYRVINMVAILGAFAAICLFYIANKGWTSANQYVVTIFVYSTVTTAYFASYVGIFKQQENISDNKVLYLKYVALSNELISYCATRSTDGDEEKSPAAFIHYVDDELATNNNIAVGFDYTKIADYKSVLSKTTNQQPAQNEPTQKQSPPVPKETPKPVKHESTNPPPRTQPRPAEETKN